VYGVTDGDVQFGAGWVGAQDRLFLMDVLRHTGRAQLSSFVGGSKGNREMDRTQWGIAPYTEADLQRQIDDAPKVYGALGTQLVARLNEYVAGINAYIEQAKNDPTKLPAEYAAFGKSPEAWKATDVIATASLIGGIFGKGGGREVQSAQALLALEQRFGRARGRRAWKGFRSKNDPEAPTTVLGKRFPYETASAFSKRGLAIPNPGSVTMQPVAPPVKAAGDGSSMGARLRRSLDGPPHASNWLLVSARESASGHPVAVIGPQVGYYVPQILMEQELHGPSFDARGAAFPGVNLMVQLGHGRDYAWSATTATSDNVDTFAEVLCQDDTHYLWKGKCLAMDKLEVENSWTPSAGDQTPPGSETLTAWRTVHGIVYARGTVGKRKVAFTSARTTYGHEADSAIGFYRLNDPNFVKDPQSFRQAVGGINFAFNWSYVDEKHIAYQLSGWYPQRARRTSPDFPLLGTGAYDWRGYNPDLRTMKTVPLSSRPNAVDPPYLVSWNNKQAPGWAAADDQYGYGPVHRQQMLAKRVRRGIAGARKMTLAKVVQAMEEPATEDLRALQALPHVLRAVGTPSDARSRGALSVLRGWIAKGAHRRDLDKDGRYDDDDAVTIMDAWWPRLLEAEFGGALGRSAFDSLKVMLPIGDHTTGDPTAPDFFDGWYGYVSKDLRQLFGRRVRGPWSRTYCGRGSRRQCRRELQASLRDALGVSRADLYGRGDCKDDAQASCFDANRSTVASAVDIPAFPFQNRPTFQQTIELTHDVPR
jgi:acyl-homoserine lactone acylase PvdQ